MEAFRMEHSPTTGHTKPSHVLIFEGVARMGETETSKTGPTIKDALRDMGYREVWHGWSPGEQYYPDSHARGGLRVWTTDTTVEPIS